MGGNVLTYFARYGKGGPLKESRVMDFDGQNVTFRKNRYGEPTEVVTLPADTFIGRRLRHAPPFNFRTLCSYGLYAPSDKRQRARSALGQLPAADPQVEPSTTETSETKYDCCEVCGTKLVLVATMPRPPPRSRRASNRRSKP